MAKGTYQTYAADTSIEDYRTDFIHRGAMCGALVKRYAALTAIGTEADAIVTQMDARRGQLQQAEDDHVRARAIEDAEKLDVADAYTEMRRTLFAKSYDIAALLPDAPSSLGRLGTKKFRDRIDQALANLKTLPDSDPVKAALLPALETEAGEFRAADDAEDATRTTLSGAKVAMTLYKTELSQAREAQLGAVLKVLGDSETHPWRFAATRPPVALCPTVQRSSLPTPWPAGRPRRCEGGTAEACVGRGDECSRSLRRLNRRPQRRGGARKCLRRLQRSRGVRRGRPSGDPQRCGGLPRSVLYGCRGAAGANSGACMRRRSA